MIDFDQTDKLNLETLPFLSISALRKLRKVKIDSMKDVKLLLETGQISDDVITMVDKILYILSKSALCTAVGITSK